MRILQIMEDSQGYKLIAAVKTWPPYERFCKSDVKMFDFKDGVLTQYNTGSELSFTVASYREALKHIFRL